jgi:two-component system, NarL family, invasion response regulator UvrY
MPAVRVALIDDHNLFRKGMTELINGFPGCKVISEANNGQDFIKNLNPDELPEVVLLDVNMPRMDGYQTADWLRQHHPDIKVLALSMFGDENAIIQMLKAGAKGYILKDAEPSELQTAIQTLMQKGFYLSELVSGTLLNSIHRQEDVSKPAVLHKELNARETEFLRWAVSELTYKEIADEMCVSTRTVDGYRETLFDKLHVKSRVGLVMFAIRNGVVVL